MTLVAFPQGLYWPYPRLGLFVAGSTPTIDANGEKFACIGRLYLPARTGSKTLDTTGSSKIGFQCSTPVVYSNSLSTLDVCIQGVNTSGPAAQPDGSTSVKSTVTTAANTTPALASNAWCEAVPTAGAVTLNHGDLFSVVWDFTNRAGVDSVLFETVSGAVNSSLPTTNANAAAAWGATGVGQMPNVAITFSDGTIGYIDGMSWLGHAASRTWTDATNPDERGCIFQVPFDCKVDALACHMRIADGNGDFTIALYSTPESGATVMNAGAATVTVDSAQLASINTDAIAILNLPAEVSLSKNTDYCVAVKATGTGNIRWQELTLGNAAHRSLFPGTTNTRSVTRNGGSGDFASSSTVLMHPLWVRISRVDDGTGTGSGGGSRSRIQSGF